MMFGKKLNLAKEIEKKNKELQILYTLDEIRDSTNDVNELLRLIIKEIVKIIDTKFGFAFLYNDTTKELEMRGTTDQGMMLFKEHHYKIFGDYANKAIKQNKPVIDNNCAELFKKYHLKVTSLLAVPLVLNDKIGGAFVLANRKSRGFNNADLEWFNAIVSQADSAIEHAKLFTR